jgi:hypothetical protein
MHAGLLTINYFENDSIIIWLCTENIHPVFVHKNYGVALLVGVHHHTVSCVSCELHLSSRFS